MKSILFTLALFAVTTSCELRSTNFDPDDQHVSEDELAQIASWDQYQVEQLTTVEYESQNAQEFVDTEFNSRQNSNGNWIVEGSVKNFATEAHFKSVQLLLSFYDESNALVAAEHHTIQDHLAPGDRSGFYFKSGEHPHATSVQVKLIRIRSVQ